MLDTLSVVKYVAAVAGNAGIRVEWGDTSTTPSTDGNVMYLPKLDAYASEHAANSLRKYVAHETSHVRYSDFGVLARYRPEGLLKWIDNLLEDHRIDHLNDSTYDGDRHVSEAYNAHLLEGLDVKAANNVQWPLFAWSFGVSDYANGTELRDALASALNEDGQNVLAKLDAGDYADILKNVRLIEDKVEGSEQVYHLAKRILEEVFGEDASKYESPEEKDGGKGVPKNDGDSDKADTEEGKGAGEGEGAGESKKERIIECEGGDFSSGEHGDMRVGINATAYECADESYVPDTATIEVDWESKTLPKYLLETSSSYRTSLAKECLKEGLGFANHARTLFQVKTRDRRVYGQKSGTIHAGNLWRGAVQDAPGFNERVFKQNVHQQTLNTAVQVLVDCSGSMSGEKIAHATAAAVMLNSVLGNILHMPVEVLGFTESYAVRQHAMYQFKRFDRKLSDEALLKRMSEVKLEDNVDGESLMYGYHRILTRKEPRKVMIVLSDGSPAGGYSKGDVDRYTRDVIQYIEGQRRVELVSIGVMFDRVKEYYKNAAVIERAEELESALINVLNKHVF